MDFKWKSASKEHLCPERWLNNPNAMKWHAPRERIKTPGCTSFNMSHYYCQYPRKLSHFRVWAQFRLWSPCRGSCLSEVQLFTGWLSSWSRSLHICPDSPLSLPLNPRPHRTFWDSRPADCSPWKQTVILLREGLQTDGSEDETKYELYEPSDQSSVCLQRVRFYYSWAFHKPAHTHTQKS